MPALDNDTAYGPTLVATALGAAVLFLAAAIVFGVAIARSDRRLRRHGTGYAVLLPLFTISGFLFELLQPVAGFAFAGATAALAVRLPMVLTRH